ncbi:MAG: hypothetical protein EOP04_07150 [Proteobacteria bacterium]|nr:MAG: hypothetical protein EOP04_07150 [Pseudomonadota bacterium]
MKKTLVFASFFSLTVACGKSGGGGGAQGPIAPVPNGTGGGGDDASGNAGFYDGLQDLNDKLIPITKIPSILVDGKFVDTCKPGQSMHLDECYDEVHFFDKPGFRFVKPGKEVTESGLLSNEWLNSFAKKDAVSNDFWLDHRRTFKCTEWCPSQTVYGSFGGSPTVVVEKAEGGFQLGSHTSFYTYFAFGGRLAKPEHLWLLNGSLTVNGRTIKLPITRRQFKEVFPEMVNDRLDTHWGQIQFSWEEEGLGFKNLPLNEDDRHLVTIDYEYVTYEERLLAEGNIDVQPDPN